MLQWENATAGLAQQSLSLFARTCRRVAGGWLRPCTGLSPCALDLQDVFRAVLYSDLDFESPPWDTLSADAKDLVQAMLQRDPEKRISAHDALHHRWGWSWASAGLDTG